MPNGIDLTTLLAFGAAATAIGAIWKLITDVKARGRVEAETKAALEAAEGRASDAKKIALDTDARLNTFMMRAEREFVTNAELMASEGRLTGAVEGLRSEIRAVGGQINGFMQALIAAKQSN